MPYKDDSKNKEYKRQWYLNNRDRILKEARALYHNNPVPKIEQVRKYRKDNPSTALRLSKENRDKELSKCLLVCANCHRLIHNSRDVK